MALTLRLERDHGRLAVHNRMVPVARLVLGLPLTVAGALFAWAVVTAVIEGVRIGGVDAALTAALQAWLSALFAFMLLPLGWWLSFGRRYLVIDPQGPTIVEVFDYRLGRKETRLAASLFRAVRVAAEPLNDESNNSDNSGAPVYCQQIRLLAREPGVQPSFEIGVLELEARNDAIAAAGQIASALGLSLEVADPGARLRSPEREINDADDLPPPDGDAEEIGDRESDDDAADEAPPAGSPR
ncbi:MAG: hypothetical protein U0P30_00625 [Vicinamibacterales bacterium]